MFATRWLIPVEKSKNPSDVLVDGVIVELVDDGSGSCFVLTFQRATEGNGDELNVLPDQLIELGEALKKLGREYKC